MKYFRILTLCSVIILLSACGESNSGVDTTTDTIKKVEKNKLELLHEEDSLMGVLLDSINREMLVRDSLIDKALAD